MKDNDFLGHDKLLHFIAGGLICILCGVIFALVFHDEPAWVSSFVGLFIAFVAGMLRELWGMGTPGNHFCWWDFLWTIVGAISVSWIPWLIATTA